MRIHRWLGFGVLLFLQMSGMELVAAVTDANRVFGYYESVDGQSLHGDRL